MAFFHIFIQSAIQGVTEFLPVSSSAHLLIYNKYIYVTKNSIHFEIAVHLGSLLAVIFLLKDVMIRSFSFFSHENKGFDLKMPLFISTIPIIITALFLETFLLIEFSRQLAVIALANIVFSIFLYIADKSKQNRSLNEITKTDALIIGIWQSFALLPGASRSGSTITGARFLKFSRKDSIMISMLMSIPTIGCSALYLLLKIADDIDRFDLNLLIVAGFCSFVFSFFSLKILLWLGQITSFTPFVVYRILLGMVIMLNNFPLCFLACKVYLPSTNR